MVAFDGTLEAARGCGALVEIPPDALAALGGGQRVTHRREYAEWVGGAKRAQARERRLVKAVAMLRAGVEHR